MKEYGIDLSEEELEAVEEAMDIDEGEDEEDGDV